MTAVARLAVAFPMVLLAAHPLRRQLREHRLPSAALGLDEARRRRLVAGDMSIAFLDYDWRLNRVP